MSTHDIGLMDAVANGGKSCASKKCGKLLAHGSKIFIDTIEHVYYCEACGTCLRFHRKKASQRGEDLPKTFEDVGKQSI